MSATVILGGGKCLGNKMSYIVRRQSSSRVDAKQLTSSERETSCVAIDQKTSSARKIVTCNIAVRKWSNDLLSM